MPAVCHAKGCKHQAKDKLRLFKFPANQERREIWRRNCGRDNAPQHARLCEYHFDDSQFEQNRQDGWRKLKPNAVPTIFHHYLSASNQVNKPFDDGVQIIKAEKIEVKQETDIENDTIYLHSADDLNINIIESGITVQSSNSINQLNIIKHLEMELKQLTAKNEQLKKDNALLRIDNKQLKHQLLAKSKSLKSLRNIMDKIPVLKQSLEGFNNITRKWSSECLKFALRIRYAVGWKSYIYLQKKLGIPLPSYSTMCRHRNQINLTPDMSKDMAFFMDARKKHHLSVRKAKTKMKKKFLPPLKVQKDTQ
ncbi:uncharacterized protein [Chelonus insularis]|uniref:uncharacterized protein n=1 Tax=Chelonus insularis TaxID=460826 RepID=UPI00158C1634|nr:uncharacterized protein LOC118069981 [Chelonus insularis]